MKQKMYYYTRIKSNSFGKWFWQVEGELTTKKLEEIIKLAILTLKV